MARKRPSQRERRRRRRGRWRKAGRAATGAAPGLAGTGAGIAGTAAAGAGGAVAAPMVAEAARRFVKWTSLDRAFQTTAERMSERERQRAKLAFETAITGIGEELDAGGRLRGDGFFRPDQDQDDSPSDAEEVLEGVLRAAYEAHEQRKAERLGDLYKFIAFRSDISPAHANYLVQLVKGLTYQQLLLLGAFSEERDYPDWTPTGFFTRRETGLTMAILDLSRRGLLVRKDHAVIQSWAEVNPAQMQTVLDGGLLVEAMDLKVAEPEEWEELTRALSYLGVFDADEPLTAVEAVIPPGSPPETQRVEMDKRAVRFETPTVGLDDLPQAD